MSHNSAVTTDNWLPTTLTIGAWTSHELHRGNLRVSLWLHHVYLRRPRCSASLRGSEVSFERNLRR